MISLDREFGEFRVFVGRFGVGVLVVELIDWSWDCLIDILIGFRCSYCFVGIFL